MASTTTSTTANQPIKVLTVGPAAGSIRALLAKIKAIDAKHGKFDFALCVGDFFGPPSALAASASPQQEAEAEPPPPHGAGTDADDIADLLEGKLDVPLECYVMQGEHPLPFAVIQKYSRTGGELCKNVFLLNKSAVATTTHGLRIACLGGAYDPDLYASSEAAPGFALPHFSTHTVERLLTNARASPASTIAAAAAAAGAAAAPTRRKDYTSLSAIAAAASASPLVSAPPPARTDALDIDILISAAWPASAPRFSAVPTPAVPHDAGAPPLDDVVRRLRPRYYFAAASGSAGVFWEREPYLWRSAGTTGEGGEGGVRVGRFVGLGAFGGEPGPGKKQRWFYAFTIAPNTTQPRPANATPNPFDGAPAAAAAARTPKRPVPDMGAGENFIWGNVQQPRHPPAKRGRVAAEGEPALPPPGYKCKRCEGTDHFISDCPERVKPPEGYVCKICNTPGHLVRDCPTRHEPGDTGGRKPRPGYVCRACGSDAHYLDDCPVANQRPGKGPRKGPPREIAPEECWFCLSNPNLSKHLIVSIGTECYLSLAKGQIIPTQPAVEGIEGVPGGGNVLIVPITHYPTLASIPPDLSPPILAETEKYKTALRALFAKHGCAAVFFEVGRLSAKGGHACVQAVPVPQRLAGQVEGAFAHEGSALGLRFEPLAAAAAAPAPDDARASYFRLDLPDGTRLVHWIPERGPFNLQFGRQVMVSLLGVPERLDWKACVLSEEDDKADAQAFKTAFAPFDPTM